MSEEVISMRPERPQAEEAGGQLTAGAMLRKAREAAGLHVAALAVSMKMPVKKLEALEADRLDLLPDAVFVRALASSVCRTLKIDPIPVLEKLPHTAIPKLDADRRGINAPFHSPGQSAGLSLPDWVAKPAVLVVFLLLAGVVTVVFYPEIQKVDHPSEAVQAPAASLPSPVMAPDPVQSSNGVPPANTDLSSLSASTAVSAAVPMPEQRTTLPPAVAQQPNAAASMLSPIGVGVDVAGPSTGMVAFKAKGSTWVEVTDAKGVVQLRKTLSTGERSAASGAMPLSVVIGRVDMTDVEVGGKPFKLDGIAKDNVARFEVK